MVKIEQNSDHIRKISKPQTDFVLICNANVHLQLADISVLRLLRLLQDNNGFDPNTKPAFLYPNESLTDREVYP